MRTKHVLLLILFVVLLAACTQNSLRSHHQQSINKNWTITLLVNGSGAGASMKVSTGPMANCRNSDDGCMVFARKEKGVITFDMSGNDAGWHITQLKICKGNSKPDPDPDSCELGFNATDFYVEEGSNVVIPNPLTGKISWEYADAVKTFVLHDQNVITQNYYYRVKACDSVNPCIEIDPPVDNKGVK